MQGREFSFSCLRALDALEVHASLLALCGVLGQHVLVLRLHVRVGPRAKGAREALHRDRRRRLHQHQWFRVVTLLCGKRRGRRQSTGCEINGHPVESKRISILQPPTFSVSEKHITESWWRPAVRMLSGAVRMLSGKGAGMAIQSHNQITNDVSRDKPEPQRFDIL